MSGPGEARAAADTRRDGAVRRRLGRVALVTAVVAAALGWAGCGLVGWVGGDFRASPDRYDQSLSPAARGLVREAVAGLDPARTLDHHTHVAGLGTDDSGATVHPEMRSWLSPIRRLKFAVYLSAAGVDDLDHADRAYLARLAALVRNTPRHGRHALLAFDQAHDDAGAPDPDHSTFHVPNAWVFAAAKAMPDIFVPVMSIHPYRADALAELERWAGAGGRMVKWLPNAMRIDPLDPRCVPYYDKMRALGLVLLSHAGEEKAVDGEDAQELGNPLRLRAALRRGVRVIVAHCASRGTSLDLDDAARPLVSSFQLFLRLMAEPQWQGLLYGELSATVLRQRAEEVLPVLLARTDLHERLVNGSDYPLPAINFLIQPSQMADLGLLDEADIEPLVELYGVNPLLFDLALKRRLHARGTRRGWPASVFEDRLGLLGPAPVALPAAATSAGAPGR